MWRRGLQFASTDSEHNQVDSHLPKIYVKMKMFMVSVTVAFTNTKSEVTMRTAKAEIP